MTKNSNVPRGTILTERLRPSMGTFRPKAHYQHNLDLSSLRNALFFGVAVGVIDRPTATLVSLFAALEEVRQYRQKGYIAETVVFQIPEYLFK